MNRALADPNGLVAAGGDLTIDTLIAAYAQGIFPWYSEGDPILWWSPDPRLVLVPGEFHISRSLARRLKRGGFRVTMDEAFPSVLQACAAPRAGEPGTWLVPEMQAAYQALHDEDLAHSVEIWMDGALIAGLYGVSLGGVFFGESMFSWRSDGSKIALAYLTAQMRRWGMALIDCQLETAHLVSLGARPLARREFVWRVADLVRRTGPVWRLDRDLDPLDGASRG